MAKTKSHTKTSGKEWFYFTSNLLSIFTFIMVAIVFFTGIAIAVQISISVKKGQAIINQLKKYVEDAEQVIKTQAEQLKVRVQDSNIPETVRAGAIMAKQKTVAVTQKAKSDVESAAAQMPANEEYMMPYSNRFTGNQYHMLG